MRRARRQLVLLISAVTCLGTTATFVRADNAAGASTLRTVSNTGPMSPGTPARYEERTAPQVSQARFSRPTSVDLGGSATNQVAAASQVQFTQPTSHVASAPAANKATNSPASSVAFVTANPAPKQPASTPNNGWVQQAQYAVPVPVMAEPIASPRVTESLPPSSLTMEPITPETSTPKFTSPSSPTNEHVPAEFYPPAPMVTALQPVETESITQAAVPAPVAKKTLTMQTPIKNFQPSLSPIVSQPAVEPPAAEQRPAGTAQAVSNHEIFNHLRRVGDVTAGIAARPSLSQMPQKSPLRPATSSSLHPAVKPHQGFQPGPTVSPYLNLYRSEDDGESAPNYYAFVRPQIEQQEANRGQQLDIQRMQRQLQNRTVATPQYGNATGKSPNAGTAARYMDTAQYYSGWQR